MPSKTPHIYTTGYLNGGVELKALKSNRTKQRCDRCVKSDDKEEEERKGRAIWAALRRCSNTSNVI